MFSKMDRKSSILLCYLLEVYCSKRSTVRLNIQVICIQYRLRDIQFELIIQMHYFHRPQRILGIELSMVQCRQCKQINMEHTCKFQHYPNILQDMSYSNHYSDKNMGFCIQCTKWCQLVRSIQNISQDTECMTKYLGLHNIHQDKSSDIHCSKDNSWSCNRCKCYRWHPNNINTSNNKL